MAFRVIASVFDEQPISGHVSEVQGDAALGTPNTAGATASARLYSLVETARANNIEPHAYLSRLAELPKAASADHFESLLP